VFAVQAVQVKTVAVYEPPMHPVPGAGEVGAVVLHVGAVSVATLQ